MAQKRVASVESTGGSGYLFEDQVGAYFAACLLAGRPALEPEDGLLERIDFQNHVHGWNLDDLLVTTRNLAGEKRLAFSIKSGPQFGQTTAPSEFVRSAWADLEKSENPVDPARDLLGLITPSLEPKLTRDLSWLVGVARAQEPAQLERAIGTPGYAGLSRRQLYSSFACPDGLSPPSKPRPLAGTLLRVLAIPQGFEFGSASGWRKASAVQFCRETLEGGNHEEALQVWGKLIRLVQDCRTNGGYLDLRKVIACLKYEHRLKDFPDHRAAWERLLQASRDAMARVADKIGGVTRLPRAADVALLQTAVEASTSVALIGASGVGKSVVARMWAEERLAAGEKVIWLEARTLERGSLEAFERDLGLLTPLKKLVEGVVGLQPALVVDGLDRVYEPATFAKFGTLVGMLHLGEEGSPWRVVLTSQTPEWPRVETRLRHAGVAVGMWKPVECSALAASDLKPIWIAFPNTARLHLQPKLEPLLRNLKMLDLVATRAPLVAPDSAAWVGESSLIKWFWTEWVGSPARAALVKSIAERQADALRSEVSEGDFGVADLDPLDGLVADRICHRADESVGFEHDLFGDWARQRILQSKKEALGPYLKDRLSLPLWHRALRLHGVFLLEQRPDIAEWETLLEQFADGEVATLAQDLLLEAPIFAADPASLLEKISSKLFERDGRLLRRFLKRFLHSATMPDQTLVGLGRASGLSEEQVSAMFRVPYWPYWLPILRFLAEHQGNVLAFAPEEAASVAELWLEKTPPAWPMRVAAAELALALGNNALVNKGRGKFPTKESRQMCFRAALLGADALPNEVAEFALRAAERGEAARQLAEPPPARTEGFRLPIPPPGFLLYDRSSEPWPDGPRKRVDEDFQQAALTNTGTALLPLMRVRPAVAREVVLALLIKAPHKGDQGSYAQREFEVERMYLWSPPLYVDGPFLLFLRQNFDEGLALIMTLVQFAVDRWADLTVAESAPRNLVLETAVGERTFTGDGRVFGWYRKLGVPPPPLAVVSALMALEQYLYEKLEAGEDITALTTTISQLAQNTAVIGLLCGLARRSPELLDGPLSPLITSLEVFQWDTRIVIQDQPSSSFLLIGAIDRGEWFMGAARAFHGQGHRKVNLEEIVTKLMLTHASVKPTLASAASRWQTVILKPDQSAYSAGYVNRMVAQFTPENWRMEQRENGDRTYTNDALQTVADENARELQEITDNSFLMTFPMRCFKILEGAETLEATQIEEFWKSLQRAESLTPEDVSAWAYGNALDAVIGGVSVLLVNHKSWLENRPARFTWCRERLVAAVLSLSQREAGNKLDDGFDWAWEVSAAKAVATLWTEAPGDIVLRQCVVAMVTRSQSKAAGALLGACARPQVRLGQNFQQLHRLVLEWASARARMASIHFASEFASATGDLKRDQVRDVEAWEASWASDFLSGDSPWDVPAWSELGRDQFGRTEANLSSLKWSSRFPRIDLEFIHATHGWLSDIDQASTSEERAEWVAFWGEALDCILANATPHAGAFGREKMDLPSEAERWVLQNAAGVAVKLCGEEHPEAFWRPILELPAQQFGRQHFWIETFLHAWHAKSLEATATPAGYVTGVRAMYEIAVSGLREPNSPAAGWANFDGPWLALLGIDNLTVEFCWARRHRSVVAELSPVYHGMTLLSGIRSKWVTPFARFMLTEAAEPIRVESLKWLDPAMEANPAALSDEGNCYAIATLLALCWREQQTALQRDQEAQAAFRSLLHMLGTRQIPIALEMLTRLGGL